MRTVQSAAMFGLIAGSALMFMGMTSANMTLTFVGMGLGMLVGVPAAYLNFILQGYTVDVEKLRLRAPQKALQQLRSSISAPKLPAPARPALPAPSNAPVDVIPVRAASDTSATNDAPAPQLIPVTPTPPHAPRPPRAKPTPPQRVQVPIDVVLDDLPAQPPLDVDVPPAPDVPPLSNAERQAIIDSVAGETDAASVLPYTEHAETLVRLYAVQRLGELGDELGAERLKAALDDPEAIVQRAARLALNKLDLETSD